MKQRERVRSISACLSIVPLLMAACSSGSPPVSVGSGGRSGTGGSSASGGTGQTASGGTTGSGGTTSSSGGATGSGGGTGTGGATGSGGTSGSGGSANPGSGGAGTGGNVGSGGSATGSGGGGGGRGGSAGSTASGGGNEGAGTGGAGGSNGRPKRVLLYSFSTSTITGVMQQVAAFQQTLQGWGYQVDQVTDPMNGMVFSDTNLAKYAGVGMINTCFFPFGANKNDTAAGIAESLALQKFVKEGGGLFGTHCAEVTFTAATSMPLYNLTLGGWAHNGKNSGDNATMTCMKMGADHPTSAMLPASFMYKGNVDMADVAKDATVLVSCTYGGSTTTPVSWVRTEGSGRVFNTSFGKVQADLTEATIGDKHIVAGLGWVLGR